MGNTLEGFGPMIVQLFLALGFSVLILSLALWISPRKKSRPYEAFERLVPFYGDVKGIFRIKISLAAVLFILFAIAAVTEIRTETKPVSNGVKAEAQEKIKKECETSGTVWSAFTCMYKKKSKPGSSSSDWSADQGAMNWDDAKAKCTGLGMRLPTRNAIIAAYESGVTESWKMGPYWTSEEWDDNAYFAGLFDFDFREADKSDTYIIVRCIRSDIEAVTQKKTEEQKRAEALELGSSSSDWSADQGAMNWNDAKAKCKGLGMRLPTRRELKAAYGSDVGKSFGTARFWTSEQYSDDIAFLFYMSLGRSGFWVRDDKIFVRCIR